MMVERSWVPDDCGPVSGLDLFNPFNEIHTDSTSKRIHTHIYEHTHTHTHTHTIIAIEGLLYFRHYHKHLFCISLRNQIFRLFLIIDEIIHFM